MEMLNRVSEVQNLPSIVSDRDAPADEATGLRLFCLLYMLEVELKRKHCVMQGICQWWQNQIMLCHNDCLQLSVWNTTIGCVFTF